jgi:VanZ family protein
MRLAPASYASGLVEINPDMAYQPTMIQRLCLVAGWLTLAFIVYATLSPLEDRPVLASPQLEHFAAFALMGIAFSLGYPKRTLLILVITIGSAFTLEVLQLLTPDRHGRVLDALVKVAGGSCGIGIGHLGLFFGAQINRTRVSSRPG